MVHSGVLTTVGGVEAKMCSAGVRRAAVASVEEAYFAAAVVAGKTVEYYTQAWAGPMVLAVLAAIAFVPLSAAGSVGRKRKDWHR